MSEAIKKGQMKDILDAINSVNEKNVYPVFVPSLQRNVMFRELTTGQEKMIVKTIVDSPIYNSEFIFAIREIIKINCTEDIGIDELTIIDKTAILLTMRQKSIGDVFTYTFKEAEKTKDIKISDYISEFEKVIIPKEVTVGNDDVQVVCAYPTILTEYELEKEFRSDFTELEVSNVADARIAIGTVFTNEIIKYIKTITIKREDGDMILDMNDYNFTNRIVILEQLGNRVLSEIMSYIENANKQIQEVLKIEMTLNKKDAETYGTSKLTSVLETGSDFFIIS